MIDVVLGVDSSTQSCTVEMRALADGRLLSTARSAHPQTTPPVSEHHPDVWWRALVAAVREILNGRDVRVRAISVGAQCHGLVVMDGEGDVIRPAKLWNDTTSDLQSAALLEAHDAAWWVEQVGLVPSAAVTLTKLAWLREHHPDDLARTAHLAVPHDWLTYRLTGRHVSDRSDASGTGFFSAHTMRWRTDILDEMVERRDWSPLLPDVREPDESAGTVTPEAAAELGLDADVLVGPGGGDQHLAALGIGLQEGDVAYSLGTSAVVFTTMRHRIPRPTGQTDGVANVTGGYLPLVCSLNGTKVTDLFAALLGVAHAELSEMALAAPLRADRPVLAAYLDGERFPRLPHARGMLSGLSGETTRESLALAAFEGVVLGLVRGERLLVDQGAEISGRTLVLGGGARSNAYRQIIADLTGRAAVRVDAPEATARGAAIQAAAVATGAAVSQLGREWAPAETDSTEPTRSRDDVWERYLRLCDLQADGSTY